MFRPDSILCGIFVLRFILETAHDEYGDADEMEEAVMIVLAYYSPKKSQADRRILIVIRTRIIDVEIALLLLLLA